MPCSGPSGAIWHVQSDFFFKILSIQLQLELLLHDAVLWPIGCYLTRVIRLSFLRPDLNYISLSFLSHDPVLWPFGCYLGRVCLRQSAVFEFNHQNCDWFWNLILGLWCFIFHHFFSRPNIFAASGIFRISNFSFLPNFRRDFNFLTLP